MDPVDEGQGATVSGPDRDAVIAALRAEDVAKHIGIDPGEQRWRGRWMRSRRCARTDHSSEAFGLARDGMWHCHACDEGGDLLALVAAAENIDIRNDFGRVLEVAAGIAGIEQEVDLFAELPAPRQPREPVTPLPSIMDRAREAKRRAAWLWDHMQVDSMVVGAYLRGRGLDPDVVTRREDVRAAPALMSKPAEGASRDAFALWNTMGPRPGTTGIAVPVRSVIDGAMLDIRVRRCEPREGQPKIIGMVGGVTAAPAVGGKPRRLMACYGKPHDIDSDVVVIVEGLMDYLSAGQVFPNAQVLGAVEAGSMSLVAAHAAAELAARGSGKIILVEQNDPPRVLRDGRVVPGAADQAINEDPNSATKMALRHIGPKRVGWLHCTAAGGPDDGEHIKDLNDMVVHDLEPAGRVVWWEEIGQRST